MDASALRELLAVMREAGVRRGQFEDSTLKIQVEFDGGRASGTAAAQKAEDGAIKFRDPATGSEVDLDDGAPETARDIDAEIAAKNLNRSEKPRA
jgi:hypothetical protein